MVPQVTLAHPHVQVVGLRTCAPEQGPTQVPLQRVLPLRQAHVQVLALRTCPPVQGL